ncbi:hypothetical protein BOX15_Mlig026146g1 [Macrostomum lignano]|uniref:Calmodulin-lysine N-methyltransferase n=1 Tax=Macrostomum lignano TaxID=282301 RepID=A0A267ETJ0_9PLAT|nr:hypothetical protein BOX15_Mlig026146g4 [Macrostomum lignano]PAA90699.1 hypothetical protein BOX15_Mlig026146g1 [Macrostomum lignano]
MNGEAATDGVASSTVARQRWRLLSRAVASYGQGKSVSVKELNSLTTVRQFCQFGLFDITEAAGARSADEFLEQTWQHVDHPEIRLQLYLRQRVPATACLTPAALGDGNNNSKTTNSSIIGSNQSGNGNNTGNICVWPSEEVLAHYVIAQAKAGELIPKEFDGDSGIRVCELGGGLTCLAGLAAGAALRPRLSHLLLTDGDQLACENAARCLTANRQILTGGEDQTSRIEARVAQLAWEDADFDKHNYGRFHLVLCADCLFFRESHRALIRTLDKLLMLPTPAATGSNKHRGGLALICAPSRGRSVEDFARLAEAAGFDVGVSDNYDPRVSQTASAEQSASFVPDLHLPLMLRLTRR